jgi:hypothetical protein
MISATDAHTDKLNVRRHTRLMVCCPLWVMMMLSRCRLVNIQSARPAADLLCLLHCGWICERQTYILAQCHRAPLTPCSVLTVLRLVGCAGLCSPRTAGMMRMGRPSFSWNRVLSSSNGCTAAAESVAAPLSFRVITVNGQQVMSK